MHADLLRQGEWIIDGYGSVASAWERFARADTLVYIDLPLTTHHRLVTKRLIKGLFAKPEGPDVRARWAYSELLSGRPYRGTGVQELKRKAMGHVHFDDLRGEERDQLEQAWYRVRGVPTFINAFAQE